MVFGLLLCTNCLHDRLVTKVKTQPWLRDSSTTQLQGGTPFFPHAMGWTSSTYTCWKPQFVYFGFLVNIINIMFYRLTQGLWQPNLAYHRLNITTKKREGRRWRSEGTSVGVSSPWPPPSLALTLVDYVLVTFGTVWPQPWATVSSPHLYQEGHSEPTVMSLSVMGPHSKHLFCWVLGP
jgi:hypothetical protein